MKKSEINSGVVLSYIQMILGMLISMAYTPIMIRLLGQSEYGLFNIAASVISYLGILDFGFSNSYIRYYSRYKYKDDEDQIANFNGLYLLVFIVIGIISLFAGFILSMNLKVIFKNGLTLEELNVTKILMMIMSVNLVISFISNIFVSYITAHEKFIFQKLINMLKTIVSPLVTLPLLLLGYRSLGIVLATTLISVITTIANIYFCVVKLNFKISFKHLEFGLFKDIIAFSGFIALNIIVDQINWNLDKFLLGRYRGSVATSIYAVASTLNSYYRNLATSFTSVFTTRIHNLINQSDNMEGVTKLFTKVGRIQFLILMLVSNGFIFFGQAFIRFWAGSNYSESYWIALLLMLPVTIPLIQGLGIEIQRAKYMHKFRSKVYIFMAIINLLISIPLCKRYGGLGCAIGTAFSILLGNGLIMNIYYKKMGLDIMFFWKNILSFVPGLIVPTIYGVIVLLKINLDKIFFLLIFGIGYMLIYIVSMWILGMNSFEKGLITNTYNKFIKRQKMKAVI